MKVMEHEFFRLGCFIMGEELDLHAEKPSSVQSRRFLSHFGVKPEHCMRLWNILDTPPKSKYKHMLWALLKLKIYGTEEALSGMTGCNEKTFRKWSYIFIVQLAKLAKHVIKWDGRSRKGIHTFSVDGTDCPINEPTPFSPKWYSHKFKSAGLRYEVAVSLYSSKILWIKGPFPCGKFPDAKIFYMFLEKKLDKGERGVADRGYHSIPQLTIKMAQQTKGYRKFIGSRRYN